MMGYDLDGALFSHDLPVECNPLFLDYNNNQYIMDKSLLLLPSARLNLMRKHVRWIDHNGLPLSELYTYSRDKSRIQKRKQFTSSNNSAVHFKIFYLIVLVMLILLIVVE